MRLNTVNLHLTGWNASICFQKVRLSHIFTQADSRSLVKSVKFHWWSWRWRTCWCYWFAQRTWLGSIPPGFTFHLSVNILYYYILQCSANTLTLLCSGIMMLLVRGLKIRMLSFPSRLTPRVSGRWSGSRVALLGKHTIIESTTLRNHTFALPWNSATSRT